MDELFAVAVITVLAVISPGADFAMVTRNSYLHGRGAGLLSSAGIALGVQIHVMYTMLGVGLLIARTPALFVAIKIVGAIYLVYIGYKTFFAHAIGIDTDTPRSSANKFGYLRNGFLTNALNPKTTLFVVSTYTQVVHVDTSFATQLGYGFFMSFAHWFWFSLVALFLSNGMLRGRLLRSQRYLNRMIGCVLIGLGLALAVLPMSR